MIVFDWINETADWLGPAATLVLVAVALACLVWLAAGIDHTADEVNRRRDRVSKMKG